MVSNIDRADGAVAEAGQDRLPPPPPTRRYGMGMPPDQMAAAFNEWMRRYTEDPAGFDAEFRIVGHFVAERAAGGTPSYGEVCAAYLQSLVPLAPVKDASRPRRLVQVDRTAVQQARDLR